MKHHILFVVTPHVTPSHQGKSKAGASIEIKMWLHQSTLFFIKGFHLSLFWTCFWTSASLRWVFKQKTGLCIQLFFAPFWANSLVCFFFWLDMFLKLLLSFFVLSVRVKPYPIQSLNTASLSSIKPGCSFLQQICLKPLQVHLHIRAYN